MRDKLERGLMMVLIIVSMIAIVALLVTGEVEAIGILYMFTLIIMTIVGEGAIFIIDEVIKRED